MTTDDRLRTLADQMYEALRLTREYVGEYVGEDVLPAIKGWSWYDAMAAYENYVEEMA